MSGKATRIELFGWNTPPMRAFHLSWLAFFACFFAWFAVAPLMPLVRAEFRLGPEQVANITIAAVAVTVFGRLLVGPRLMSIFLLMPCLVVISDLAAILGGQLISKWAFGISALNFYRTALDSLYLKDIVGGVLKSFMFGGIIGLVACYKGLTVRGGAAGVGDSTTSSVVTAITTVIAFDTVFNIVQQSLFK